VAFCEGAGIDPLKYALAGGEDYELLFTTLPEEFDRLKSAWPEEFETPLFRIGEMDKALEGIHLVSKEGDERRLDEQSFEHFT
jgi:thiamine-monophosphate kinase